MPPQKEFIQPSGSPCWQTLFTIPTIINVHIHVATHSMSFYFSIQFPFHSNNQTQFHFITSSFPNPNAPASQQHSHQFHLTSKNNTNLVGHSWRRRVRDRCAERPLSLEGKCQIHFSTFCFLTTIARNEIMNVTHPHGPEPSQVLSMDLAWLCIALAPRLKVDK